MDLKFCGNAVAGCKKYNDGYCAHEFCTSRISLDNATQDQINKVLLTYLGKVLSNQQKIMENMKYIPQIR